MFKETMSKELKESMRMMSHMTKFKEKDRYLKVKQKFLNYKVQLTKIKNSLGSLNVRFEKAEKRIIELEYRPIKSIHSEGKKKK